MTVGGDTSGDGDLSEQGARAGLAPIGNPHREISSGGHGSMAFKHKLWKSCSDRESLPTLSIAAPISTSRNGAHPALGTGSGKSNATGGGQGGRPAPSVGPETVGQGTGALPAAGRSRASWVPDGPNRRRGFVSAALTTPGETTRRPIWAFQASEVERTLHGDRMPPF